MNLELFHNGSETTCVAKSGVSLRSDVVPQQEVVAGCGKHVAGVDCHPLRLQVHVLGCEITLRTFGIY